MRSQSDDLYLLQDGTYVPASDVRADDKGVLRHADGRAVAMGDDNQPQTLAGGAVHNYNAAAAAMADPDANSVTEVQEKLLSEQGASPTEAPPVPPADQTPSGARTAARQVPPPANVKPAEETKSAPLTKATLP